MLCLICQVHKVGARVVQKEWELIVRSDQTSLSWIFGNKV